jgi:hypothetical protein
VFPIYLLVRLAIYAAVPSRKVEVMGCANYAREWADLILASMGAQTAFRHVLVVANIPIHLLPSLVEQAACFYVSTLASSDGVTYVFAFAPRRCNQPWGHI